MALGLFSGWGILNSLAIQQQYISNSIDALEIRLDSLESWRHSPSRASNSIQDHKHRLDLLEEWRIETSNNRFRASDGEALRQIVLGFATEMRNTKKSVIEHNQKAEKYIEKILSMEKHVHRHWHDVDKE